MVATVLSMFLSETTDLPAALALIATQPKGIAALPNQSMPVPELWIETGLLAAPFHAAPRDHPAGPTGRIAVSLDVLIASVEP